MQSRPECSHQDTGDDRSSGQPQPDRHAHARDGERDRAYYEPDCKSDEYREQVRVAQLFFLIAKDLCHSVDSFGIAHDGEFVSELESERR